MQNGDNFLCKYDVGKGKLYTSAVSLGADFSNFAKHSVFVPTLYKIGMFSQSSSPLFYTIGSNSSIESANVLTGESVFHIKGVNSTFDVIPEHKVQDSKTEIFIHNQITDAGNYLLYADKDLVTGLSFNFNRKESDLTCYNADELKKQISDKNIQNIQVIETSAKSLTQTLTETDQGKKLWKLCIIMVLLFLAVEIALLRFMKG